MSSFSNNVAGLRAAIEEFIQGRLSAKLDKLKPEQGEKRAKLEWAHRPENWLADAARRVGQIQLATHTLKPIHPDARGTNLYVKPEPLEGVGLVGTHSVSDQGADDVVGNAAALDVFKFLKVEYGGRSLMQLAQVRDAAFLKALSEDAHAASEWCAAFASINETKSAPASHTLAKQVFFPLPDGTYHLLAPLFPTSLVHVAQRKMRDDRFGESAKAAREAYKKGERHPHGFREYPNLAIQKFGGTKPQNISQLNSERYGENWLLPALPPTWKSARVRPPLHAASVFDRYFGRRRQVADLTRALRQFLERTSHNNITIRRHRAFLVEQICEQAHLYAMELWHLEPGWTAKEGCALDESEQLWLDPFRTQSDNEFGKRRHWNDWPSQVAHRFGNWLNTEITSKRLTVGEAEHQQWERDLSSEMSMFRDVLEQEREDERQEVS